MAAINMTEFDVENFTLTQKFALLIIGADGYKPLKGKLWLQKTLFLLSKNNSELADDVNFESDFMGPYSEIADEEIEQLELMNFIKKDVNKIKITDQGKALVRLFVEDISDNQKEMVTEFKKLLNDLTDDELLAFIYFSYPDYTDESIKTKDVVKNRRDIAFKLFKKDKISIGKAAEIAGIPLESFKKELIKKGLSVF